MENIRKTAEREAESYGIAKAITEIKNEVKDRETERDVLMSDYFKTLREPFLEAQKKSDEKQERVIEQLAKNQRALTNGLQDIAALNRELPQIEETSEAAASAKPAAELPIIYDLSKAFHSNELEWLSKNHGLANPNDLVKMSPDEFEENEKSTKRFPASLVILREVTLKKLTT